MNDFVSPLQSISYTNKDFPAIYEELLDLVHQLNDKWDPGNDSNESDPGVILIKLCALIGDKCNYSIDKNVLECFPLSVTQLANARQLFEQLGYYMHWKRSATTDVTLSWIGNPTEGAEVNINPFTTVSDSEDTIIYTLLGSLDPISPKGYSIENIKFKCSGSSNNFTVVRAIQGVPIQYDIAGNKLITAANLDSNNRIYFNSTNIAENGIFITHAGYDSYSSWKRVDNLVVEELGQYLYRFGVSKDSNSCYIEFPDDIASLIGEGIYITYIKTDAQYGNISAKYLSKFYDDITTVINEENIILDTNLVSISNSSSANNGVDYESIDSAYFNYKHTVGTFKTLVTLRDYANALIESNLASNGFVCDRSNDVQLSYDAMTVSNNVEQKITYIENEELNAFSLKFYVLQYEEVIKDENTFNTTFRVIDNNGIENIEEYLADFKSVQHNILGIKEPTAEMPHVCMFKNIYPISCSLILQTSLSAANKLEVINNVKNALFIKLNSKNLEFGEEISYNLIYDIIMEADNRIKNVSLDNIIYFTKAVYYDESSNIIYDEETDKWYDNEWNIVIPAAYGLDPKYPKDGAQVLLPPSFKEIYINGLNYDDISFYSNTSDLTYVPLNSRNEENVSNVEIDSEVLYTKKGSKACYDELQVDCIMSIPTYSWYMSYVIDGEAHEKRIGDSTALHDQFGITIYSDSYETVKCYDRDNGRDKYRLDLKHYDTSEVPIGRYFKVISDETKNHRTTLYRYTGALDNPWEYANIEANDSLKVLFSKTISKSAIYDMTEKLHPGFDAKIFEGSMRDFIIPPDPEEQDGKSYVIFTYKKDSSNPTWATAGIHVGYAGTDKKENLVKDTVDVYAYSEDETDFRLIDYPVSGLRLYDIIKVLYDETKNNETTYYRWSGIEWIRYEIIDLDEYGIKINNLANITAGNAFRIKLSYAHQVKFDTFAKSVLAGKTQLFIKDEKFDYKLNQIMIPDIIENVTNITGNSTIKFNNEAEENLHYKLRDNEALQFYAPSMIDVTQYSNYVKFEYFINSNVESDSDYMLRENEYVAFYWTDDTYAGVIYKYQIYGFGTIIHPSFYISRSIGRDENIAVDPNYNLVKYDDEKRVINSSSALDGNMSTECSTKISNITDVNKILMSSKSISIKKLNQIKIDASSQCYIYWTLNDTLNDRYVLFNESETSRILNDGEYIFYTNKYKKDFVVLGSGTEISRNTIDIPWSVEIVDTTKVLTDGISALNGKWFSISSADEIDITENKFVNVGSNCEVKIKPIIADNFYTLKIIESFTDLDKFYIANRDKWLNTTNRLQGTYKVIYHQDDNKWFLSLNAAEEIETSLEELGLFIDPELLLEDRNSVTIKVTYKYELTFDRNGYSIEANSDLIHKLSDFSIKYKLPDMEDIDENWVDIGNVDLKGIDGWNGRSIMSLDFGPANQLYIYKNQKIEYSKLLSTSTQATADGEIVGEDLSTRITYDFINKVNIKDTLKLNLEVFSQKFPECRLYTFTYNPSSKKWFNGDEEINLSEYGIYNVEIEDNLKEATFGVFLYIGNVYPCVVLGSYDISVTSTQKVGTRYLTYDDSGNIVTNYLSIYNFKELQDVQNTVSYDLTGSVNIMVPPAINRRSIQFNLPEGDYILAVTHLQKNLTKLVASVDNILLKSMYSEFLKDETDSSNLKDPGTYYLKMSVKDNSQGIHTLSFEAEGHDLQFIIFLDNCYKYNKPKNMSLFDYNLIQERLTFLDNKHIFKYNYEVPENIVISDPVAGESFNNKNHIYNRYTIPQLSGSISIM